MSSLRILSNTLQLTQVSETGRSLAATDFFPLFKDWDNRGCPPLLGHLSAAVQRFPVSVILVHFRLILLSNLLKNLAQILFNTR